MKLEKLFYLIYKAYINATRLKKAIPNPEAFERHVKYETMKMAESNPSNNDLIENMIPLRTGREKSIDDTVELLEEYEGNNGKCKYSSFDGMQFVPLLNALIIDCLDLGGQGCGRQSRLHRCRKDKWFPLTSL